MTVDPLSTVEAGLRGLRPPIWPAFPPRRPVTVLAGRRAPGLIITRPHAESHDASLASSVPASRNPPTPKSAVLFVVTGWLDSGA
jgi:hypothetical protein